nr:RNA-binding S4 domain-containing protein [Steroidobacter denitrificans]
MSEQQRGAGLRIDKWLWCARFFKSRAQATQAVIGGRVHVDAERVKPSRMVYVGDRLEITREALRFEVVVTAIPVRRGPAAEAQGCYAETPASIAARERHQAQSRMAAHAAPSGRPDKHARRVLRDLRRG